MKKFIVFLPFLFLLACENAPTEKVVENLETTISGMIENANGGEVAIILSGEKVTTPVDESGKFSTTFELEESTIAQFSYGRERTSIYLTPGDNFEVKLNTAEFDETISYTGKGAEVNNYLASKYLLDEELSSDWRTIFGLGTEEFVAKVKNIQQKMMANFKKAYAANTEMSPDFVKMEKENLRIATANNLLMYPEYYAYVTKEDAPEMPAEYYDFLSGFTFNDDKMLASQDFKSFVQAYLTHKATAMVDEGNDAQFAEEEAQMKLIGTFSDNQKVKDYAYYTMMGGLLYEHGADIPENIVATFQANCKDEEQVAKVMEEYQQWAKIAKGKEAPNWTYETITGEQFGLEDMRGKVVYVDVWATWCGPCKGELPYLEKLIEEYEAGGKIAFTSVSIDENKEAWEKMVTEKEMKGIQLFADKAWKSSICTDNLITGIPRFMLIDEAGKIMDVNAPRPSSKEINEIFEKIQNGKEFLSLK